MVDNVSRRPWLTDWAWQCLAPNWQTHVFLTVVDAPQTSGQKTRRHFSVSTQFSQVQCQRNSKALPLRRHAGTTRRRQLLHGIGRAWLNSFQKYRNISYRNISQILKCPKVAMPVVCTIDGYMLHTLPGMRMNILWTCFCVPLEWAVNKNFNVSCSSAFFQVVQAVRNNFDQSFHILGQSLRADMRSLQWLLWSGPWISIFSIWSILPNYDIIESWP
jgi:hypothetical protein